MVAVCAMGSTASSIATITDSGSTWTLRAYVNNGTAVRSEIWSTAPGGSVASTAFTVNISGGAPARLSRSKSIPALRACGATSNKRSHLRHLVGRSADHGTQRLHSCGIRANSYDGYTMIAGTTRRELTGLTSNAGGDYVEMALCDNTAGTATALSCAIRFGVCWPWAALP